MRNFDFKRYTSRPKKTVASLLKGFSAFLAELLGRGKFKGTESYPANFQAANGCSKILADLILHSKRHIFPSENNRNQSLLFSESLR